jgi:Ca2+-binding RTX toxin-like protein
LLGGAGNDTLDGWLGNDALYGGTGNDMLDGGAGSDTYHFGRGDGQDTAIAKSSQPGEKDRLQLGHGIAQRDVSVRADNADLVLTLSGGTDSIRLIDYLLQPQDDRTVVAFADGSVWNTVEMERQARNQAPVVGVPLADAAVSEGASFRYVVPAGAFTDADGDDALTLSIGLAGGAPLPQWLQFDAASGVLEGVPPTGSATALNLVVTATDRFGASVHDGFDLVVAPAVVTINGTAQADRLTGTAANDEIRGFAGNDMLLGGAGNDLLDGGAGIDSMSGGAGNDTYVVDSTGDRVIENAGEGIDRVNASISHTLGSMVEALTLTGTGAIQGTGNALDNMLVGNAAGNVLSGAGGNDTLDGGAGRDTLVGGTGNDVYRLARGHGIDTVVESDATVGNTDTLQLGADIASAQLWFARSGSNLEVSVIGTGDKAVINGWYGGNRYHVEQFRSGDGKLLLDSQVDGLVNAMAAFAPPAAGQTTLPANHQAGLDAVIASSWK